MATFFYESMWDFAVFAFLMNYMRKNRREGNVLFFYLVLYGFGRMIIEGFRMDSQILFNTGLRVNQLISALFVIFGALMLLIRKNARIVEAYRVPLFPKSEKQQKRMEEKAEQRAHEEDLSNLSDDLKLMDDDARMKRRQPNPKSTEQEQEIETEPEQDKPEQ